MFSKVSILALSSFIALTNTGTKCSPLYFKWSGCSSSIITGLSPSSARISCALNPYLTSPCGVSSSLDFLNWNETGFNWLTKSKPWGTVPKFVLSLKSDVTVQATLM